MKPKVCNVWEYIKQSINKFPPQENTSPLLQPEINKYNNLQLLI